MLRVMPNDDPYASPLHYDLEYADHLEDIPYYIGLAQRVGGPVLELGCGNGRITLAIAQSGVEVHGVDANPGMLADLERKRHAQPDAVRSRLHVERGDFRQLSGPPRYPLVILPFNTIHHCRDHRDVLALLRGVREVLLPGGRFAFDMYLPFPELYARDPAQRYGERTFIDPRDGETIASWEQSAWDPLTQIHHVHYVYDRGDGAPHEVHLDLRMFYPQELRALLDWAGFEVIAEASDFHGRALNAHATKWVLVTAPRDDAARAGPV